MRSQLKVIAIYLVISGVVLALCLGLPMLFFDHEHPGDASPALGLLWFVTSFSFACVAIPVCLAATAERLESKLQSRKFAMYKALGRCLYALPLISAFCFFSALSESLFKAASSVQIAFSVALALICGACFYLWGLRIRQNE